MPLTVGFDATAAARQDAGIGRYARELLRALTRRDDEYRFRIFHAGGDTGRLPPLPGRFQARALPVSDRVTNAIWHRLRIPAPAQALIGRFDLFHSPDFTAPPTFGRPSIITVHDLAFVRHPECAYPTLRAYLDAVVPRQAQRAAHVLTVSENSRADVIEMLGVSPDRVSVAYPGVSAPFMQPSGPDEARAALHGSGIETPFILTVGTLEPRKNYVRLLEAFSLLRGQGLAHRLVIAGQRGWLYEPIFDRIEQLHLQGSVRFLRPDDETLRALYALADAYVSASVYEGFGIPVAEALAAGLPVGSSSAASLPEVVGEAAVMFDPYDVDGMANAIGRLLTDESLSSSLRQAGPLQAARFTWERTAEAAVAAYRAVLDA